jgi:arylsulfatase A-like enzyme
MTDPPRVVLLSLDAFPHDAVSPDLTPCLWHLAAAGGRAPNGGRCDLPSVTYVSHATLATGTHPATHGVTTNMAAHPKPGVVPGWAGEANVRIPTLFDAVRDAGLRSAAVCGDQHLVRIMEAERGGVAWPPGGVLPAGTPTCASGYATNAAIREPLLAAARDRGLDFLFGHVNETDTLGHLYSPDDPRTRAGHAAADALVGEIIDAVRPDWERVVFIVLSDHGMEEVRGEPVDLLAGDAAGVFAGVVNDGGAALVCLAEGVPPAVANDVLSRVPGVAAWHALRDGVLLVSGEPGVVFSTGSTKHVNGMHGGPGTMTTTAIVGGGHPAVSRIAADIASRPPHLADWAPTIAAILGGSLPTAEGRILMG